VVEADLSFRGASSEFPGERLAVVDVGGGSTEVIFGTTQKGVEFAHSFNIGCRRITEMFIHHDPPRAEELAAARAYLHESFSERLTSEVVSHALQRVVAVAGTATSVVSIDLAMESYDSARVHKTVVPDTTLDAVLNMLASMTEEERKSVVGLEPKRASVIVAGMLILQAVLQVLGKNSFTVSEYDILQGLVMAASEKIHA
jgi:exopolyphosphatase/guanosine-5'-triphosphate,3'-diphosphate pyrophosphatase